MTTVGPSSEVVEDDIISTLPENVLSQIMECLSLCDAARASVLSKTWGSTWLSLPKLTFDAMFFKDLLKGKQYNASKISAVVSSILLYHVGPVPKVEFSISTVQSARDFIAPCLSYLSKNNVKEITLQNNDCNKERMRVPSRLFSCLDLQKLHLTCCILDVPSLIEGGGCFRNLLNLHLDDIEFVENSFTRLVKISPQLEMLTLLKWRDCKKVNIHALKIKWLTLSGNFVSVWVRSPKNLVSLSITLDEMVQKFRTHRSRELIQLLSQSSNLEKLFLGGYTFKLLSSGGVVSMNPLNYRSLRVLMLSNIEANHLIEFRILLGVIRSYPTVEVLKISFSSVIGAEHEIDDAMCGSLDHLREVEVACVKGYSMELKLIQFLLNNSPVLHLFSVKPSGTITADLQSLMTRQLMRFPRASPRAEIIYVDPKPSTEQI